MKGIKDLNILLKSIKPKLMGESFVFCTVKNLKLKLKDEAIMIFKEKEGITIILEKKIADQNKISYENEWAMITLTVHSNLNAIGFLAVITNKLASNGISINAVSAYYHDHLFVPIGKSKEAMKLLNELST
ncbi:ACT domain-containing protein [Candidatus Woesearchaeota archaeon]|nr:ACT domain-containing protein [Candidatus Woesearchaeota archaeon]